MDPIVWLMMIAGGVLGASTGAAVGKSTSRSLRASDPEAHRIVSNALRNLSLLNS